MVEHCSSNLYFVNSIISNHLDKSLQMKLLFSLFYFLLLSSFSFGQTQINYPIKYQIETLPNPQMLELIKFNDSTYSGSIVTTFLVVENMESKDFTQEVSNSSAKVVFESLTKNGINSLEPCDNCDNIFHMDGDNVNFKIYENNKFVSKIGFDEIYHSQNNRIENNPIRRKAQILIDIIEENIGMEKHFGILLGELSAGSFSWCTGNRTVTYKIPN